MPPSAAPGGKICGICGEDCSTRPRTKDAQGHYYCRDCYEKARQQKAAKPASAPAKAAAAPARAIPAARPVAPAEPSDDFGLIDDLAMLESSAQVVETPAVETCGGCGAIVAPGTVVCTACGFNRKTGAKLSSVVVADV